MISVDETEDPWVMLKVEGDEELRFRASDNPDKLDIQTTSEIEVIVDACIRLS